MEPLTILLFIITNFLLLIFFSTENKWKALLISSLIFYFFIIGYKIIFLIALAFCIYQMSFLIERKKIKTWLIVILILLPLLLEKLTHDTFHSETTFSKGISINSVFDLRNVLQIIGISYFTFNALSYIIDIKRKYLQPEKNFFLVLLYLIFFPCIFSGPLHRAKYLFHQFKSMAINDETISSGLRLMLWGLFKYRVVAERIGALIKYLLVFKIGGFYYLFVGLLFFFYLYFSFSAFIDFFQGVAAIFGIKLKDNFRNRIYFSNSRQSFWKGWHITLNEWFRDYFFFEIIRLDRKRKFTNLFLFLTFVLIGLWHEFTFIFLLWGCLNGLWILIEKQIDLEKLPFKNFRKYAGVIYHLSIASCLALLFFSKSATELFKKIFVEQSHFPITFFSTMSNNLVILIFSFLLVEYHSIKSGEEKFNDYMQRKSLTNRWLVYFQLALMIVLFGLNAQMENDYIQF